MVTQENVVNNCPRHAGTFKSCNPNCAPIAYVSKDIADAFGMHDLPNTVVVNPHTPTPWKQTGHRITGGEHQVESMSVSLSGSVGKPHMTTAHDVSFAVRHEQDAAFIVRAVNAHEELLEALRSIRDYARTMTLGIDRATIKEFANNAIARAEGK